MKTRLWLGPLLAAAIMGCNENSGTGPVGTGTELPAGHFFILSSSDDSYQFEQYFVVLPGHTWEFVEYGYLPGQKANLCQVTRQRGSYSTTDSAITLTATHSGKSLEKCGMTKADFQAYPFTAVPGGAKESFGLRSVTANSFQALDMFIGSEGWVAYRAVADPYGFY